MTHVNDEQLVLFHYGDADDHAVIREHLEVCDNCRAAYGRLRATLGTVTELAIPERGDSYGDKIWQNIQPNIRIDTDHQEQIKPMFPWRRVAWVTATAAALVLAFLTGRFSQDATVELSESDSTSIPEKVLVIAMNEHLERTSMMLVELVNAQGNGTIDLKLEQPRARELVVNNRLYRQAAQRDGDRAMAMLLDQVERVLMEVANAPAEMPADDYDIVRREIQDDGLLFKVRVLQSRNTDKQHKDIQDSLPGVI